MHIYNYKWRFLGSSPSTHFARRRAAGSLFLRRPLRRREDGGTPDLGLYIVGFGRVPSDGVVVMATVSARCLVSARSFTGGGVLRDIDAARAASGGLGSADPLASFVPGYREWGGRPPRSGAAAAIPSSSPPSCGHAEAESDDFPAATKPTAGYKVTPAPGGSGGSGAAARPRSASEAVGSAVKTGFWTTVDMASGRYLWRTLVAAPAKSESDKSR